VQADQIERLDLKVHRLALGLTGKAEPQHGYDAQVSVYHWAAAVLRYGAAGLPQASDECVRDPEVLAVRAHVHPVVDEKLGPDAADATLTLKDGRTLRAQVRDCLGSAARPMSDAQIEKKFLDQAAAMLPHGRAKQLAEQCWNIASVADVGRAAPGVWG
jgi:2-methylcitrate dehydratase PrpD